MVARVAEVWRYPVKSMAGELLTEAALSWHGLAGDRRWAFVRPDRPRSGFPWLTIRDRPDLHHHRPVFVDPADPDGSRVRVTTPDGTGFAVEDPALAERLGPGVRALKQSRGIPDEAPVSLLTRQSVAALSRRLGVDLDRRRFRPNLLLDVNDGEEFPEEAWVGRSVRIGEAVVVRVDQSDERCALVNVNPDTLARESDVLRTIVRERDQRLGVYGTVATPGIVRVGDPVTLSD